MQCKDIPDIPILKFLAEHPDSEIRRGEFCNLPCTWFAGYENSVQSAMPKGVLPKLALSKMRSLIKRGLAEGCSCGCRGDFEISEKGKQFLKSEALRVLEGRQ